jgi:uncharacterized protein (DUF427 family)
MGVMAKAIWENTILAESDKTIEVEGNQYFPPDAIKGEYFQPSDQHTTCPWKGLASYYTVDVNGKRNANAAWYYPEPKPAARQIKGYVAFWKGVKVEKN